MSRFLFETLRHFVLEGSRDQCVFFFQLASILITFKVAISKKRTISQKDIYHLKTLQFNLNLSHIMCNEKCKNYLVNDGPKLVVIILWVLANIAVFAERFIGKDLFNSHVHWLDCPILTCLSLTFTDMLFDWICSLWNGQSQHEARLLPSNPWGNSVIGKSECRFH